MKARRHKTETPLGRRRSAAQDLRQSLSLLRASLESTADGVLVVDREGRITIHNQKFAEMWGIPAGILATGDDAQALAFVNRQLIDPEEFYAKVRSLYATPNETSFDVIQLTRGRVFERYSQPQRLGEQIVGRVWSFRDVTERARADDRLRERTAELHAVLDTMFDSVIACDADRRLIFINKAARRWLGIGLDEGAPLPDLDEFFRGIAIRSLDGQLLEFSDYPLLRALRGEATSSIDLLVDYPDGRQRTLRTSAAPVLDPQGHVILAVGVGRDITGLVELDRLKDQFVRVAAHELKTPVAVMKASVQLALRQPDEVPKALLKMLKGIARGVDRIDRIVRNLLDISQLVLGPLPMTLEPLDLGELIEDVTNRFEVLAPHHPFRLRLESGVSVRANRDRLSQVVEAFVDNAVRYSPQGGPIEVSMSTRGREAVVCVEDHGVGIATQKRPYIFGRFYRAHSGSAVDSGGMGDGLYLARELVRQHGGATWFESTEGSGSRFTFSLPLITPEASR